MGCSTSPAVLSDIAPSEYHLFRSMTHDLADHRFRSYEETKNGRFLDSLNRPGVFSMRNTYAASDGQYFE